MGKPMLTLKPSLCSGVLYIDWPSSHGSDSVEVQSFFHLGVFKNSHRWRWVTLTRGHSRQHFYFWFWRWWLLIGGVVEFTSQSARVPCFGCVASRSMYFWCEPCQRLNYCRRENIYLCTIISKSIRHPRRSTSETLPVMYKATCLSHGSMLASVLHLLLSDVMLLRTTACRSLTPALQRCF